METVCWTHLPLATGHSNVHESPSMGDSLFSAAFWSVIKSECGREGETKERDMRLLSLGARPAIARFISTYPITGRVCVEKLSHPVKQLGVGDLGGVVPLTERRRGCGRIGMVPLESVI